MSHRVIKNKNIKKYIVIVKFEQITNKPQLRKTKKCFYFRNSVIK